MAKNLGQLIFDTIYNLTSGFNHDYAKEKIEKELLPELMAKYPSQGTRLEKYLNSQSLIVLKNIPESVSRAVIPEDFKEPILNKEVEEKMVLFLEEWKQSEVLKTFKLHPRHKINLWGPPGNGKTMLASSIAKKLELPLFVANFHKIIDSYMGKSSANLHTLIEFARTNPCVLFLDEFDTIAFARNSLSGGDTGAETRRITNQLLLSLETLPPHTVLIAATNEHELLDKAIKRRFDTEIFIDYPNDDSRQRIVDFEFRDEVVPNFFDIKKDDLIKNIFESKQYKSAYDLVVLCESIRRDMALNKGINVSKIIEYKKENKK